MLNMVRALSNFYCPRKDRNAEASCKIPPAEIGYSIVFLSREM